MILRRYHPPADDAEPDQGTDEQPTDAPPATKPAGRSAAPSKAKKTDGG
ncbi:hypothetical protein ACFRQM_32405 [Streptomyces sp. NPDC056831]